MDIFKEYTDTINQYLTKNIEDRIKTHKIEKFYELLESRHNQIDEELLEMLISFIDFQLFKSLMLGKHQ